MGLQHRFSGSGQTEGDICVCLSHCFLAHVLTRFLPQSYVDSLMSKNTVILHGSIKGSCKTDLLSGFLTCGIQQGICFFPECTLSTYKYGQNTTSGVVRKDR